MACGERQHAKRKFDLDTDTLICPICTETLSPPVYQCQNGHTACAACCKKIRKGCPSCSKPIGSNRNIAVEKIIESLVVSCTYTHHGCDEMPNYSKREVHEAHCKYRPIPCPVSSCSHECPKHTLPLHIRWNHNVELVVLDPASASVAFTMEAKDQYMVVEVDFSQRRYFLVHHEVRKNLGDVFFCTSLCAPNNYYLTVQLESESKFFAMETLAHDIEREVDWKHDFLLIPRKPNSQVSRQFVLELWLTDQSETADNDWSDEENIDDAGSE